MQTQAPQFLCLFADCKVVQGYGRSVILDLTRARYDYIPNHLAELLTQFHRQPLRSVFDFYGEENADTIDSYLDFLQTNEYIFLAEESELDLYPPMSDEWAEPAQVISATVHLQALDFPSAAALLSELENAGCRALFIHSQAPATTAQLSRIAQLLQSSSFEAELVLPYSDSLNDAALTNYQQHTKIRQLTLFNAPATETHGNVQLQTGGFAFTRKAHIVNPGHRFYTESLHYNAYLNRKLFVDAEGRVSPHHSSTEVFGHLDEGLAELLQKPQWNQLFTASKQKTDICRQCEYRNHCFDARLPQQRSANEWFHTTDCGYNPYINKWEGEEGYCSPSASGIESSAEAFHMDEAVLNTLNEALWAD